MAILKCEMCGGNLIINKGEKIAVCESCGTQQTVFYFDDKKTEGSRFTIVQKPDYAVTAKELVENEAFRQQPGNLVFALGKDYKGNAIYGDLNQLQHLLITGVSGYGKTNCLRSILYSLHQKNDFPEEVSRIKFLLIDPKKIEFSDFENFPTLLVPVVTNVQRASGALGWAVSESLRRIQAFSDCGVRDIESYNRYAEKHNDLEKMPDIIIVIDDFYQVYSAAPKDVEENILKIIQNGRICGMHLIISSLQADRKFLPDKIKNSIPSKITFALRTKAESKYAIDRNGAENLTVVGDSLYLPMGTSKVTQVKCGLVTDEDVSRIKEKFLSESEYSEEIEKEIFNNSPAYYRLQNERNDEIDPLFEKAVEVVLENGRASTSFLQRKLDVGYSRGSKIMDLLEEKGIIAPQDGAKPREIRINMQQWTQMKASDSSYEQNLDFSEGNDESSELIREINATTRQNQQQDYGTKTQASSLGQYIHQKIYIDKKMPEGTATFEIKPEQLKRVEFTKAKLFKKGQISIFFKYEIMYEIKQDGSEFPLIRNTDHVTIVFDKSENDMFFNQYQQINEMIK